jgi:DNA primase
MDAVEEVKNRLAIEDVVGEYVQLKRSGRNFKGLSPFGPEKTPSFMVSPEKQIWHDFSSGKGGNVFSFIMEMEGLDFKGALELLARKAGVDLEQYRTGSTSGSGKQKERLFEVLEMATKFYQAQLKGSHIALEYLLKKRVFTKQTIQYFRMGYSPNGDSALTSFLLKHGFTETELKQAGVSTQRYRGLGDMFRGRMMIPLMDVQGRVIGFTARLLESDANAPKYINTPQTNLYDKSRHVFGLHAAKEGIRLKKYAVVVEGNMDVIASYQAGVTNVVATAGTAMTTMHLKTLGRFTTDIRLAFDEDAAGVNATERSIPLAASVGVQLKIIDIPAGKDPDELIKKDPKLWEEVSNGGVYAVDWLIGRYKKSLDLTSAQGKRQFSDIILTTIRKLPDSVEQDHYLHMLADLTGVSVDAMRSKLHTINKTEQEIPVRLKKNSKPPAYDKKAAEYAKLQDRLLCLLFVQTNVRALHTPLLPELLSTPEQKLLHTFLMHNPDYSGGKQLPPDLTSVADYVKILILQFEELYQNVDLPELMAEATRLKAQLLERYVKSKKLEIVASLAHVNDELQTNLLLEEVKKLDQLLSEKRS